MLSFDSKMRLLVFCVFAASPVLGQNKGGGVSGNASFIEQELSAYANGLLAARAFQNITRLVFVCNARIDNESAADFLRDVFVASAQAAGKRIVLKALSNDTSATVRDAHHLRLTIEKWDLTANRFSGKIVQKFSSEIRHTFADSAGRIIETNVTVIDRERNLPNFSALEMAEIGQPEFAQTRKRFTPGKKDILSTVLIAAATTASVYLLFSLRSQ